MSNQINQEDHSFNSCSIAKAVRKKIETRIKVDVKLTQKQSLYNSRSIRLTNVKTRTSRELRRQQQDV